jgi:hypothetical protein
MPHCRGNSLDRKAAASNNEASVFPAQGPAYNESAIRYCMINSEDNSHAIDVENPLAIFLLLPLFILSNANWAIVPHGFAAPRMTFRGRTASGAPAPRKRKCLGE